MTAVRAWGPDGKATAEGSGIRVDLGPHWLEVLARGVDTADALGAFVFTHDKIVENPPHAHLDYGKFLYVLDGQYHFRVGDALFSGEPGTLVLVPRGSQHTFTTPTGGRVLFVCSPSGNEEMFLEMGKLGPDASPEQMADVADRFRMVGMPGDNGLPWRPPD